MRINDLKSQVEEELRRLKFLGYYIGDGIPWKKHEDWLIALLYPEIPDLEWDQVQSRALGLFYANICVDRYVEHICRSLIQLRPFNVILSRNFERGMKMIGVNLEMLDPFNIPT